MDDLKIRVKIPMKIAKKLTMASQNAAQLERGLPNIDLDQTARKVIAITQLVITAFGQMT